MDFDDILATNTMNGTSTQNERVVFLLRGLALSWSIAIFVLALWVITILMRCKHIASQFKYLYANLFVSDGIFGIALFMHILVQKISLPFCVLLYLTMNSSLLAYLLTIVVICADRVISLWKVIPFLIQFRVRCIIANIISIWILAVLFQSLASLDGFTHYTVCRQVDIAGRGELLAVVVTCTTLLVICVVLMVTTVALQRKHLQIMAVAPIAHGRHIIGEYVKTALKELPACGLSLIIYIPLIVRHFIFLSDYENRAYYKALPSIEFVPLTAKLFSSIIICATRFPEFRYRIPAAMFPCSRRVQSWSMKNLEVYYPTVPTFVQGRNLSTRPCEQEANISKTM